MSVQTFLFNVMCRRNDAKRDKGLIPPDTIIHHDNIKYGPFGQWNLLDVYLPKNAKGKLPVIVNFHGGAWVYGTKETYRYYCMSLAEQGFAVINPTYRLAPRYRYPAAFEDIYKVFCFVTEKAEKYGFDTERVFGIGDSSGAMGIAAFASAQTNKELEKRLDLYFPPGTKIRALCLNCGIFTTKDKEAAFVNILPPGKEKEVLSVLDVVSNITSDFPPCYIMTSVDDFNRGEQQVLIDALERNGVRYEYKVYGDENNRLGHVFHCDIRNETAKQANLDELNFLRSCTDL